MNRVILMGRLTKNPEIKYAGKDNDMAVARYTLAVNRRYKRDGEQEADFISCVTFGKSAEFAQKYLRKGIRIVIGGRISTGSYFVGRDADGIPRYAHCRGTGEIKYRGDVTGSDKSYGFSYRGMDNQLFVFEAAIDLLSFIQLFPKDWKKRSYLSLGGVSSVEWLWFPYIPFGKLTIIQGNPGEGKTYFAMMLTAACTNRKLFPNNMEDIEPFNVIYQTAEDGMGDTIKPRLVEAGADLSRVMVIDDTEEALTLSDDRIEKAVRQNHVRLVIIDPVQAFIGADELLDGKEGKATETKLERGTKLIRELLADKKEISIRELDEKAKEQGISGRTMRDVRSRMKNELEYQVNEKQENSIRLKE